VTALEGERTRLAPLRDGDIEQLFEWINDRELVLFSAAYGPVHESNHRDWFDAIRRREDVAIFGIHTRDDNRLIGTCQLVAIHPVHRTAELQIRIGAEADRGSGVGTEAVRLLLRHGFEDLGLRRVQLLVFADNERAVRAYRAAGFEQEGVLRQAAFVGGRARDMVLMAVVCDDAAS
jgi:RimJ/RimL family protein N-acetyltransferase